ncbi:MAG: hypothetical protein MHM6MM_008302 [Cercozoa sp. M6MM]
MLCGFVFRCVWDFRCFLRVCGVCIFFHLCAGKVHGSLSRAGKVRSQTPKQEKTEKPRKVTGRARKRAVFNRRYDEIQHDKRVQPNRQSVFFSSLFVCELSLFAVFNAQEEGLSSIFSGTSAFDESFRMPLQ